jgi:hypothetical protein
LYSVLGRSRSPADLDIAAVDKIYHDAMRQGDTKAAEVAQAAMEAARNLLEPPIEEDFGLPREQLEEMRRMAAEMSDAEFEKFREESGKFIPLPLFDLVMAEVREKSSRRPPPEQCRRAARTTDQLELFNP